MPASDATYTAQWLSADAGVSAVLVKGVAAAITDTEIKAVLPYGSVLPATAEEIVITAAAGAVASVPETADEGATWTFTVTAADGTTQLTYTLHVSVAGRAPVFLFPTADQLVTVVEDTKLTLAVQATDEPVYQWQVNDGKGWVDIPEETFAFCKFTVTKAENGYQYRCVATNAYGRTESPIFTLKVEAAVELPQTGDDFHMGLWLMLMTLAGAGVMFLRKRAYN